MANLLLSNGLPAPGPLSGWYARTGRYGPTISSAPEVTRQANGPAARSYPCDALGGATLADIRRTWLSVQATRWTTLPLANRTSFADQAPITPYTTLEGTLKYGSDWDLYSHMVNASFGPYCLGAVAFGGGPIPIGDWFIEEDATEPDPPAIVSAAWDGKNSPTIALSNYATADCLFAAVYVTTPARTIVSAQGIFCIGFTEPSAFSTWADVEWLPTPSDILLPWPQNATCLLGMRVWLAAYEEYLPSPIAATGIQIGA